MENEKIMCSVIVDGKKYLYEKGTSYEKIAQDFSSEIGEEIYLVRVDHYVQELGKVLEKDGAVMEMIPANTKIGNLAYRRSCSFLAIKAICDVFGKDNITRCRLDFSVDKGYYIDLDGDIEWQDDTVDKIRERMKEMVEADLPFAKKSVSVREAMEMFHENKMYDKEKLLRFRRTSRVNLYELDGYVDYYYGHMLPSTGYLKYFDIFRYGRGVTVVMPTEKKPYEIKEFEPVQKLYELQIDSSDWLEMMNVSTVGGLNDAICDGSIQELILAQEAIMEKKIGDIADRICKDPRVKFVMIAGPSSSGKTTFSHRLSVQIRAHGKNPHPIAIDNYFQDRENVPKDENGEYDFECLEAVNVEMFNEDMSALLRGEEITLPIFNFKAGKCERRGRKMRISENDVLVLEGIHGLNEKLSYSLPKENKLKIYISALPQLNIDEHNRIPTTDSRLLRRIVRDSRLRGYDAKATIHGWDSVRRGEERNIFPYQDEAEIMINSSLVYELPVIKTYAEPLLYSITSEDEEYDEAQRLLKFLSYFLGLDSSFVPIQSILKEFIGGGCFDVS